MRSSAVARLVVMGVLALSLLIPLTWVYSIVSERASRRDATVTEVSGTWGRPQTIGGPVLSVPYTVTWMDASGRPQRSTLRAHFLARDLQIDGTLNTEIRRRGIFDVIVYRGQLKVTGRFVRPDTSWIRPVPERIDWQQATVSVGISDPRGLTRRAALSWRGVDLSFAGGVSDVGLFQNGIHATVTGLEEAQPGAELPFAFAIDVNGTRDARFMPAAEETTVTLTSAWPHPSFVGGPLPDTRQLDSAGFSARWHVADFGRPYPARWTSGETNPQQLVKQADESTFGVSLVQPVDIYHQAERAVKYAALFVVLTFLVFFLWEVFHAALLHPMQYAFVGFALCVFYLLLVSISEHAGFDIAYGISAGVTTLLISLYARAILRGTRQGASVLAALTTLYAFLYLLLRLEDYALLAGSIGLFIVLAFVMFITRRMNWYELKLGSVTPGPSRAAD
jgi:inner membrane protein